MSNPPRSDTQAKGPRRIALALDAAEAPVYGTLHGAVSARRGAPEGVRVRLLERRSGHVDAHNVTRVLDEHVIPASALRSGGEARFALTADTAQTSHDGEHVRVDHWVSARLLGAETFVTVDVRLTPCAFDAARRDGLVKRWRRGALVDRIGDGLLLYVVAVGMIGIPCFALWAGMVALGLGGLWESVSEGDLKSGQLCSALAVLGFAFLIGYGGKDIVKDALIGVWARLRLRGGVALDSDVLCRGERGRAVLNTTLAVPIRWRLRHVEESAQIKTTERRGSTIRTKVWEPKSWWWHKDDPPAASRASEFAFTVPEDAAPHLHEEDHKIRWEVTATAKLGSYERVFSAPVYVLPMRPADATDADA